MKHEFKCSQCGENKIYESDITTGYGKDSKGNIFCYECISKNDPQALIDLPIGKKEIQYWDGKNIINWPSSLKINPYYVRKGKHNIAGTREDIYFKFGGFNFHAVQYGSFSQIAHIRKLKN